LREETFNEILKEEQAEELRWLLRDE